MRSQVNNQKFCIYKKFNIEYEKIFLNSVFRKRLGISIDYKIKIVKYFLKLHFITKKYCFQEINEKRKSTTLFDSPSFPHSLDVIFIVQTIFWGHLLFRITRKLQSFLRNSSYRLWITKRVITFLCKFQDMGPMFWIWVHFFFI